MHLWQGLAWVVLVGAPASPLPALVSLPVGLVKTNRDLDRSHSCLPDQLAGWRAVQFATGHNRNRGSCASVIDVTCRRLCGGWGHADLPGTCTTKEARLMSKARGWWRVARQWPARYYGQTDDDCGILTLPATLALTLTLRPSHPHSPIATQPSPCPHAPPSTLTLTPP